MKTEPPIAGPSEPAQSQAPPTYSIYQFGDCPLSIFRQCLISNDWSGLVREGSPSLAIVEDAGLTLYSDWCSARGGVQIIALIERSKTISASSGRIDRINTLLHIARALLQYGIIDDKIVEAFAGAGFKAESEKMRSDDAAVCQKALISIESKLKTEGLRLEGMRVDRDKPKKDHRNPEQRRKEEAEHFTDEVVAVETALKISVDEEKVTTEKYCGYIRRLQQQIAHLEKQKRHVSRTR